jgi:polyisoprenoid-binding protein YceI
MKNYSKLILVVTLALSLSATVFAQEAPSNPCGGKAMHSGNSNGSIFHINDPMGRNSVTFKSEAPLEDIVGTSGEISGQIWFDPQNPKAGGKGKLVVPVASLNTGIPLRDDHLRGADWLDADRYPNIELTIDRADNVKKVKSTTAADTYDLTLYGTFFLHGQAHPVKFDGRITYLKESEQTKQRLPGDLLAARASFSVPLKDYNVTGPQGMNLIGSKVGESIEVEVSFVGNTTASMAENPCGGKATTVSAGNPCGGKAMNKVGNPCGEKAEGNAGNPCSR